MKPEHCKKRFELLWTERKSNLEQTWETVTKYVRPSGVRPYKTNTNETAVEWRTPRDIYDSTACVSAVLLASAMHGAITAGEWFDLRFRDPDINRDKRAKEWLETCAGMVGSTLAEAAFADEAAKAYYDLTTYGTAAIMGEQKNPNPGEWDGMVFTTVPTKEVYFEVDHRDRPYQFFRLLNWPLTKMVSLWGVDALPGDMREEYYGNPNRRYEIIFCIYRREEVPAWADPREARRPEDMPYGYCYVLRASGEPIGDEGGYYEMPAYMPRWRLKSDSMWGHSPAMDALGDVISINELARLDLRAREIALEPPQKAEVNSVVGTIKVGPRGITLLRDINKLQPLNTGIRYDAADAGINDLRDRIREYFYVPQLELKSSPAMTATEVNVRYQKMQEFMSPTLGRIRADLLDPVVMGTFNLLMREGQLPEPPDEVSGADMDVEYHGQISRALASDRAMAMENFAAYLMQFGELMPDLLDTINPMEFARELAVQRDVPQAILRSEDEVQQLQQERAAMQARMMEAQAEAAEGEAARATGEGTAAIQALNGGRAA